MTTLQRRRQLSPPVTRCFEFTRIHAQLLSDAYNSLIPIISRRPQRPRSRLDDNTAEAKIQGFRSRVEGA